MMTRTFRVIIAVCLGVVLLLAMSVVAVAGNTTGGSAYNQYCAACHGASGQGTAFGPDIQGAGGDVYEAVRGGEEGMPSFSSAQIDDATLGAIASYVSSLKTASGSQYGHGADHESAGHDQYGHHERHHDRHGSHSGKSHEDREDD